MYNRDVNNIFESYKHNKLVTPLSEAEQQGQELKDKLEQQLQTPDAQKQLLNAAKQLQQKYAQQIANAKSQGPAAVDKLLKDIELELSKAAAQQVQKESLNTVEEGFLDRMSSRGSGLANSVLGRRAGQTGNAPTYDQAKIAKRFAITKTQIEKDLRELQRDLGTTSNVDKSVKDKVDQIIADLGTTGVAGTTYTPHQSKLGDIRHGIGNFAQNVVTGGLIGGAVVLAASPIIGALGLTGAAAAAVTAGTAGSTTSLLKDLISGQQPNFKKAAVTGVAAAATAGLIRYGLDQLHGAGATAAAPTHGTGGATPTTGAGGHLQGAGDLNPIGPDGNVRPGVLNNYGGSTPTPTPKGDEFVNLHGSGANAHSSLDSAKQALANLLHQKGAEGVSKGVKGIASPHIMNAIDRIGKDTDTYNKVITALTKTSAAGVRNLAKMKEDDIVATLLGKIGK